MTVAERGQVTIPKKYRTELGIKPGSVLEMTLDHGVIHVEKITQQDPFEQVFGCLKKSKTTDEIISELRGKH